MPQRTQRLYYDDPYRREFQAHIVERTQAGDKAAVVLDHTCFYPTSGGQQHDTGLLADIPVLDVQVTGQGDVLHVLAAPLPEDVETVQGRIDWPRRYDHMQQHSGQHLLSQAFHRLLGLETVSVHFGEVLCTLDLDAPALGPEQLERVEEHANRVVWGNRRIRSYWVPEEKLAQVPLRRPPKVTGQIRIVEIEDYDWSACGGTHVARTGEIGPIALLRVERHRGRSRVHFLCGGRAVQHYRRQRGLLGAVSALLDASPEDAPELVGKMQARLKEQDRSLRAMQEQLLSYRAQSLLAQARPVKGLRLVAQTLPDLDAKGLKGLAAALTEGQNEEGKGVEKVVALLGGGQDEKGVVVFARSPDVPLHMGRLLGRVLGQFGGGGGGRPEMAQGGGVAANQLEDVLALAAAEVEGLP